MDCVSNLTSLLLAPEESIDFATGQGPITESDLNYYADSFLRDISVSENVDKLNRIAKSVEKFSVAHNILFAGALAFIAVKIFK
jgi:hypothetical protein